MHVEARLDHTANSRYSRLFAVKDLSYKPSADTAGFVCGQILQRRSFILCRFAAYGLSP
jgi:hypothetical protein